MTSIAFPIPVHQLLDDLIWLIKPTGVVASRDQLFGAGVFLRDFALQVHDLDPWLPSFIEKGIFHAASCMARDANAVTEARGFGHLPHQVRTEFIGPERSSPHDLRILGELAKCWGGDKNGVFYHGMADIGPQFIRILIQHVKRYGPQILNVEVRHVHAPQDYAQMVKGWDIYTLDEVLLANVRLLANQIAESDIGLYEFYRTNFEGGHSWKVMRDGSLSIMHPNGQLANADGRIATIELQGLAYDALMLASDFYQDQLPQEVGYWRELAALIQQSTLDKFWHPTGDDSGFFVLAIDRDPSLPHVWRQVEIDNSAQFELLETTIFDNLPSDAQQYHISNLMWRQRSAQHLGHAGIRMVSSDHHGIINFAGYQWDQVAWGVTQHIVARGNEYQGFAPFGTDLRNRQINACAIGQQVREFFYDIDGVVYHRYTNLNNRCADSPEGPVIIGINVPEGGQGFNLSGILRAYFMQVQPLDLPHHPPTGWRAELLCQLQHESPLVSLISPEEALEKYLLEPVAYVDTQEASRRAAQILKAQRQAVVIQP